MDNRPTHYTGNNLHETRKDAACLLLSIIPVYTLAEIPVLRPGLIKNGSENMKLLICYLTEILLG
jgi:hypothetical protein